MKTIASLSALALIACSISAHSEIFSTDAAPSALKGGQNNVTPLKSIERPNLNRIAIDPSEMIPTGFDVQVDGKILVLTHTSLDYQLYRYLPGLSRDPTFGVGGKVELDPTEGLDLMPNQIQALPNGKIRLFGYSDSVDKGFVRQLNADGSDDQSFGGSKILNCTQHKERSSQLDSLANGESFSIAHDYPTGDTNTIYVGTPKIFHISPSGGIEKYCQFETLPGAKRYLHHIARDSQGRYLLTGSTVQPIQPFISRYIANDPGTPWTLDESFASSGTLMIRGVDRSVATVHSNRKAFPRSDGKIWFVGTTSTEGSDSPSTWNAFLLESNGDIIPGPDGVQSAKIQVGTTEMTLQAVQPPTFKGEGRYIESFMQPDGKLIVLFTDGGNGVGNLKALRLNRDGSLDSGFSLPSSIQLKDGNNSLDEANYNLFKLLPDGRLFIVGHHNQSPYITGFQAYQPGSYPYFNEGPDIRAVDTLQ